MQNNKKNPNTKSRILSVEETNARIEKEFAEQDAKTEDSPPKSGDSNVLETSMRSSSSVVEQAIGNFSEETAEGSDGLPLHESKGNYFPADSHATDENAKKLLTRHIRYSKKRVQNPSLLLNDLTELGMFGELAEDQRHTTMPFEDVRRLVTTMRMAELILNERIQNKQKADNYPNMLVTPSAEWYVVLQGTTSTLVVPVLI
jgi:hypothetical protein